MVKGYYSHDINEETYQRAGLLAQGHTAGRRQKLYHAVPLLCWVWDEDLWGLTWCSQTCLLHGPWWTRHEENPSLTVSTQPGGTVFRPRPWGLINENKWMGQYNLMPYWKKPFSKMEILIHRSLKTGSVSNFFLSFCFFLNQLEGQMYQERVINKCFKYY